MDKLHDNHGAEVPEASGKRSDAAAGRLDHVHKQGGTQTLCIIPFHSILFLRGGGFVNACPNTDVCFFVSLFVFF